MTPGTNKREEPLVKGEFLFTGEDFTRIAKILHGDSGIYMPESKATLMYSRLAKRLRALGLKSFRDYCELVSQDNQMDERRAMMASLTTNVTRFFREGHHFEDLRDTMMPTLAETARAGGRVRLWSAGCSNGAEPYTMAMTVLAALPEANELDVKILASDIDPNIVNEARAGEYRADLMESIPREYRRYAEPIREDTWRMGDDARALIAFRELNLFSSWPFKGRFDVIFCRNVAIYFEETAQEQLWERFGERMKPDSRLYIGHSERIRSRKFSSCGLTTYRYGNEESAHV
jgi:chemotaxis protein methyltransferase CheR